MSGVAVSALLVAIVALPALSSLLGALAGAERREAVARLTGAATLGGFGLTLILAVEVTVSGPVSAVWTGDGGGAVLGLYADRVGVVLLILVLGISALTQAYARRYLRGDRHAARFFWASALLTAATAAMVSAATLIGLAVAWTLAGVALCLLLGMYPGLAAAEEGVRRTRRAFAIGDSALWLAVAIAVLAWGNLDLRHLDAQAARWGSGGVLTAVACLLVVAALARSAQLPLQSWLPATLAAPTPVSALLHAGVINAGGVLLVRLSPLFGASAAATHLAFAAGGATAVYGTALMLAKPDVKGALAHSTMGQMGFMIMTCGLGAFAAAIFHLLAHGMYKATLFLGSGAAVQRHLREQAAPPLPLVDRRRRAIAALLALAAPALALAGAARVLHTPVDGVQGSGALLAFAWATGAWAAWGWLRRHPNPGAAPFLLVATAAAALAYVGLLSAVTEFLAPALAGAGTATVSNWELALVFAALAVATICRAGAPKRWASLQETIYVWVLSAGYVGPGRPLRSRWASILPHNLLAGPLVPRSEGSRP